MQPQARIIALTLYESSTYFEDMVAAGAKGYMSKTGAPTKVAEAIRAIAGDKTYFDDSIPRGSSVSVHTQRVVDELTETQMAVPKRLADGQTNPEIAADLGLSLPEIERHRSAAMNKLNVRSRAELARVAAARQW
jgi:DNA-binding NarL/FixJ family response regulator